MKLSEKHAALAAELQSLRQDFQGLTVRLGSSAAAQRELDRVGAKLIALEHEGGVADARHLLAHEAVTDDLATFEAEVKLHTQRLEESKKAVASLLRIRSEADQRRAKLSKEALAIASQPDSLSQFERESFTQIFNYTKAERATNSALSGILQPV